MAQMAYKPFMAQLKYYLDQPLYDYTAALSGDEPACLKDLREASKVTRGHSMLIRPEQAAFLRLFITTLAPKNALEIGVFTGFSALNTALCLPQGGKLTAVDHNPRWRDLCLEYWDKAGMSERIELVNKTGLDFMTRAAENGERFDYIFIDADKENYPAYFELGLKLLSINGVMVLDNVLLWGRVIQNDPDNPLWVKAIDRLNPPYRQP